MMTLKNAETWEKLFWSNGFIGKEKSSEFVIIGFVRGIFANNFVDDKEKIRGNTVVLQGFLTQQAA